MDLKAFMNANREWASRAGSRWAAAALSINSGTYDAKHLFRDLLRSWIDDPLKWYDDILRETDIGRILISVKGLATRKSDLIPVPHPQETHITALCRLGGSEEMRIAATDPKDINVILDKPESDAGTVQVTLLNLDHRHPPGQYVGFIYEDQTLIAYVVALR